MHRIKYAFFCVFSLLLSAQAFAISKALAVSQAYGSAKNLGEIADNVVQGPFAIIIGFIDDAFYVSGIMMLVVGFHKYFRHRHNPQEVPISTPIVYVILGVILILLPFVYVWANG